jgi:hypothetical protein
MKTIKHKHMKKIFLLFTTMAVVLASCVKNDPYEPEIIPPVDDSPLAGKLALNEINGQGADDQKYIELYNISGDPINLSGVKIYYNNAGSTPAVTWTGTATQTIQANQFLVLQGTKGGDMSTGLSGSQGITIDLRDAADKRIDIFQVDVNTNGGSYSRIPDGTGDWFFTSTAGTKGKSNGTNTAGLKPITPSDAPVIANLQQNPVIPTSSQSVTVTATVTTPQGTNLSTVVLKWKVNSTNQTDITMAATGTNYTATIPSQANSATVAYTIVATNDKSKTAELSENYVVTDATIDYSKLVINEVNGVGKWFEIYNTGDVAINLNGVTAYYSNQEPAVYNLTWTGDATQTVPAKGWFSTQGITLGTGLSANNANVRLQLRAPSGTALDTYEKLIDINNGYDAIKNKSHARIPDGTGSWYYTANGDGTSGAANGTSTTDYTKFGDEAGAANPPPAADYTQLVLNEIDGNAKAIELYNKGTVALSLTGVTLWKNVDTAPSGTAWWTGTAASGSIEPGAYILIYQTGQRPGGDVAGFIGANGISPQQTLRFELLDPANQSLGVFIRGSSPWGVTISPVSPNSYQRIPNGTGNWQMATPTLGSANPANGTNIPSN